MRSSLAGSETTYSAPFGDDLLHGLVVVLCGLVERAIVCLPQCLGLLDQGLAGLLCGIEELGSEVVEGSDAACGREERAVRLPERAALFVEVLCDVVGSPSARVLFLARLVVSGKGEDGGVARDAKLGRELAART